MAVNYFLIVLLCIMGQGSMGAQKKYGQLVFQRSQSIYLYSVGTSVLALLFFYIMSGGNLAQDRNALIFGLVYAGICSALIFIQFLAYARMNLIIWSVFGKGNVIISWLIGVLGFDEMIKWTDILAVTLIFVTVIAPLFVKQNAKGIKMKGSSYFIGILNILVSGGGTLLTQIYYKLPTTTSQTVSAMCFYTNVFLVFIMIGVFCFSARRVNGGCGVIQEIKMVKPIYFLFIPLYTICQNPSTLISAHVLKTMPLSTYTLFNVGAGSVCLYIASRFLFKEKPQKLELSMWIIATLAGLLTMF